MKKLITVITVSLVIALMVSVAPASANDAVSKLTRGVVNGAFGWVDFFTDIRDQGVIEGFIPGITDTIKRELAGAVEIVTFPIGVPNEDFSPIVEPESPFDKM